MKTFIIESARFPTEIIYAKDKVSALNEYAKEYGYKSILDLQLDCSKHIGINVQPQDILDIECISQERML